MLMVQKSSSRVEIQNLTMFFCGEVSNRVMEPPTWIVDDTDDGKNSTPPGMYILKPCKSWDICQPQLVR